MFYSALDTMLMGELRKEDIMDGVGLGCWSQSFADYFWNYSKTYMGGGT